MVAATTIGLMSNRTDRGAFKAYTDRLDYLTSNDALREIVNGNPVGNLPTVDLDNGTGTYDPFVETCRGGVHLIDSIDTTKPIAVLRSECTEACGVNGVLYKVEDVENDVIVVGGRRLGRGYWCVRTPTRCNLNTAYIVANPYNEPVCITRYPNLYAADSTIAACTGGVGESAYAGHLWDAARGSWATPLATMTSEEEHDDESNGPRFYCRFDKQYVAHPENRFRGILNPCTHTLYNPSDSVSLHIDTQSRTWYCDCGDYEVTRVKNKNPDDRQSTCTSCFNQFRDGTDDSTIGVNCFHAGTRASQVGDTLHLPCPPEKYLRGDGAQCVRTNVRMDAYQAPFPGMKHEVATKKIKLRVDPNNRGVFYRGGIFENGDDSLGVNTGLYKPAS